MRSAYTVRDELAEGAEIVTKMGSPFFGTLLKRASEAYDDDALLRSLLDANAGSRIGLRLGGAAHFRALRGYAAEIAAHYPSTGGDGDARAAWEAIAADLHANAAEYGRLLARHVQTNEVARSMPVLGAMLSVASETPLPLRIFEIGSSAGLNLNFDRYRYSGDGWTWGDARSPVHLQNRTRAGRPAHVDAALKIAQRSGCDLNPLDVRNAGDADTLLCFVWPDQTERFERLRAALAVAREHPPRVERGDGIAWARNAAAPVAGTATVLMHTVITEHMSGDQRVALAGTIAHLALEATPAAPFVWLRMEPGERGYATTVTLWPGGSETAICASDGHAQNLRWLACG